MAQIENFVIDNGTGSAVRADINRALMALATTNTGATAPLNPVFGMLWVDTATASLKIYAGSDNWLIITDSINSTTISGSMTFPTGTRMVFNQASPPTGWNLIGGSQYSNTSMRVVTGAGGGVGSGVQIGYWNESHVNHAGGTHSSTSTISVHASKYVDVIIGIKA
jgi:hypothetical protein